MADTDGNTRASSARLAAEAWAEVREPLDRQLSPLGLRAMCALAPAPGEQILDVGCGAGQSVLQLADAVGESGSVVGLDIAAALLRIARRRASGRANVTFIEGDAQVAALQPCAFDAIFSRFGVMAFADPVAAFANLRGALRPGGRLAFVCWRSLAENDLDLVPLRAAGLERAADMTPFAFEDPGRVRDILLSAGFGAITIDAHDEHVGSGSLEAMLTVVTRVGPLGRILRENLALRTAAEPPVRAALASHAGPDGVTLRAATWIVTAQAVGKASSSGV